MNLSHLFKTYTSFLESEQFQGNPQSLYESMNYIMSLGGKRIRPILVLAGYDIAIEANKSEANTATVEQLNNCLNIAHAIEIFHNFSLVHDDIMDAADLRRGKPTVHKKWNEPTAILSGDNLLIKAFQYLMRYEGENKEAIIHIFNKTAVLICEGQQEDMEFASLDQVSEADYLRMIQNKTAVLLGCALQIGALAGGMKMDDSQHLYDLAIDIGLQFQMMDDYLDAFGDSGSTGKISGGDIAEGKKTWLYIKSSEMNIDTASWFETPNPERIELVQNHWKSMKLDQHLLDKAKTFENAAIQQIEYLESKNYNLDIIKEIVAYLGGRKN